MINMDDISIAFNAPGISDHFVFLQTDKYRGGVVQSIANESVCIVEKKYLS